MTESINFDPEKSRFNGGLEPVGIDQLAELIEESDGAFLPSASDPEQTTAKLFEVLKDSSGFQPYGYMVNGRPASYIVALGYKDPSVISIGPMYVAEGYRGNGLGSRQVVDFLAHATEGGYAAVYTKTWSANLLSRRIFESLGFVNVCIKINDRVDGDSTIEYLRLLY